MPFRCSPLLIVKRLVQVSIRNTDQFPFKDNVSEAHRQFTIVTRAPPTEHANFNTDFGVHADIFEDNAVLSNTNEPRGHAEMCIGQTPCRKPGQCLVSLMSGLRVKRNEGTELPVPDKVIDIENEMDRKQCQSWMRNVETIISIRREGNVT